MSQSSSTPTSSTNFGTIFTKALKTYKSQTGKDISLHPLATRLQSCDSSSAILAVLRTMFDQSQSADERWTKWLDPTVNVLFAFSAILNSVTGLVFPPATLVFAGIGVLLQAIKDVRDSQSALIDLFGRIEYLFKRLETYINVRPTAAMTDFIIKITVEVISILGIVTKEIGEGWINKYLKKLFGRKDVEDALQRLDKLTQEEARMATAEVLTITRDTDDTMKGANNRLEVINERVQSVNTKMEAIDVTVQSVGSKVQGVDGRVQGIDDTVKDLDHKVGSVTQGVKENGVAIQQVVNQVNDLNRNELRKDLRKWVAPPDPSINFNTASSAHHQGTAEWCTKGKPLTNWKTSGSLLWIHGKPGSGKSILRCVTPRRAAS
ncbi:hypothetical protein H4582DRAFT_1091152 [Lactarius indigo]|nr:hypothetical protein H4582DRAFT_1091152 [Lactarius indigo]